MDVFRTSAPEKGIPTPAAQDPRLQATPDYGTLGPGSDLQKNSLPATGPTDNRPTGANLRLLHLVAAVLGIFCALLVSHGGPFIDAWRRVSDGRSTRKPSHAAAGATSERDLDRQKPQKQAELLLARAVSRNDNANDNDGAAEEIQAHVESWRGKIAWNPQLSDLTTVALNSSDQSVRASAIEIQLAAYGLSKNNSTVDDLVQQADSSDHAKKIWALWSLGLLANRGVGTGRVVQVLTAHLNDSQKDSGNTNNEDARRWAVEGLALVGTTSTIEPLLAAMHDDPSALVRERAACSLAESGMLSHEQRMIAVPKLIAYSDDPALDAQTHTWAYQALGDITKQRLPNDSAAWREWYQGQ
jgi:PBS lyase HEAT-like repeat